MLCVVVDSFLLDTSKHALCALAYDLEMSFGYPHQRQVLVLAQPAVPPYYSLIYHIILHISYYNIIVIM